MKPKNALQRQIVELSKTLPIITEDQKKYSENKSFQSWGVISRNKFHCLECGSNWLNKEIESKTKDKPLVTTKKTEKLQCPNCNKKIKLFNYNQVRFIENEYFAILTVVKGFQVVRMLFTQKHMHKNEVPTYSHTEVMQHWIQENGEVTTLAKAVNSMGQNGCYDSWVLWSELEVKSKGGNDSLRFKLNPYKVFPNKKVLPILKRNGFKGNFYNVAPQRLFTTILKDSLAETLLKTKQIEALKYKIYDEYSKLDKYANSLRICIKNNYLIKDYSTWEDYLSLLEFFGKDLNNTKYICPVDLKTEHNKLVTKKRAYQKKQDLEKQRTKVIEAQKTYLEQKKQFFGLQFSDGKIQIKFLESVQEIMEEGDILKHCVFTNAYYEREKSLILSARIDNQPIETIEFSIKEMKIKQARGMQNKATQHHNDIINLVNSNIYKIKRLSKQKKVA